MNDARIRWQCRRGMRELDELLIRWLDTGYDLATPARKSAFRALLDLQDPELAGYLFSRQVPLDPQLADVVKAILDQTRPD